MYKYINKNLFLSLSQNTKHIRAYTTASDTQNKNSWIFALLVLKIDLKTLFLELIKLDAATIGFTIFNNKSER